MLMKDRYRKESNRNRPRDCRCAKVTGGQLVLKRIQENILRPTCSDHRIPHEPSTQWGVQLTPGPDGQGNNVADVAAKKD
jgi:hypothetical protein